MAGLAVVSAHGNQDPEPGLPGLNDGEMLIRIVGAWQILSADGGSIAMLTKDHQLRWWPGDAAPSAAPWDQGSCRIY